MYSDRSSGRKRSVMDRLGSDGGGGASRSRPDDAKRFCQADGTWRRELYKDSGGIQSSSGLTSRNIQSSQKSQLEQSIGAFKKLSVPDLREKLSGVQSTQKSQLQQSIGTLKKSSVSDLREKLSGSRHPQLSSTVEIPKPVKVIVKSDKPVQKRDPPSAPPVTKKISAPAPTAPKRSVQEPPALAPSAPMESAPAPAPAPAPSSPKQSQEKADGSLDSLLQSLDLEKYLINFQAEEVDMKALVHMNEEDMKSLGIPMGPRKKILSALASRKKKSSKSLPRS